MAQFVPDTKKIRSFQTVMAFETWFSANHDRETELWIRIFRKDSGVATLTAAEALDVALCWGWIDGIRKRFDESSFLQRHASAAEGHLEPDQPGAHRAAGSCRPYDRAWAAAGRRRQGRRPFGRGLCTSARGHPGDNPR